MIATRVIPSEPVSILMPVCNEIEVLESVVREWERDVIRFLPSGSELVFDEAASTDGTSELIDRLIRELPFIRVHHHSVKDGFAEAARRLYQDARCPLVFFTDSDGQYVPAEFWKLTPLMDGSKMVHGAKRGRRDPLFRKVASFFFNGINRVLFRTRFADINSAFRLIRREVVLEYLPRLTVMPTLLNAELLLRMEQNRLPIAQVLVAHRPRLHGPSRALPKSQFFSECWRAFRGVLRLRSEILSR